MQQQLHVACSLHSKNKAFMACPSKSAAGKRLFYRGCLGILPSALIIFGFNAWTTDIKRRSEYSKNQIRVQHF
jgi:hypothetical protein